MIRGNLSGLVLAGMLAVNPVSNALAHPLGSALADDANIISVQEWAGYYQGHREHCWRLRSHAQELRQQIYYARPWERDRIERHLSGIRERIRAECWEG
jgi:hypothetical protein